MSVPVAASPETVWELITDVTQTGRWSPECTGGRWTKGASGPIMDARFVGSNRHGVVRWSTHCTVVAAEEPNHFAFEVAESKMRWGYRLAAQDGGTVLTEYRQSVGNAPWYIAWISRVGLLGRDREGQMAEGMARTLQAVKAAAEGAD